MDNKKTILVTGAAGFIGYHLCEALLKSGHKVIGLDNINDYYDVNLKFARLQLLGIERKGAEVYNTISNSAIWSSQMQFIRMNLEDRKALPKLFKEFKFNLVCNLAAQAGVRYSLENPEAYIDSNINGFLNVLESCRHHSVKRMVYASSSSIYGNSDKVPFNESDSVDKPISLYAATKKSNELMAHTYGHLYGFKTTGLRFFTVYGPWGRPDMAYYLFAEAISKDKPIKVFNNGEMQRDFTYIDDIIEVLLLIIENEPKDKYRIYNIGNHKSEKLGDFIATIEKLLGKTAQKEFLPMQPGDVSQTYADVTDLIEDYGYAPNTSIGEGLKCFVQWYLKSEMK